MQDRNNLKMQLCWWSFEQVLGVKMHTLKIPKHIILNVSERELTEIYNALISLNLDIRDNPKLKNRTKFVQKLIQEIQKWN